MIGAKSTFFAGRSHHNTTTMPSNYEVMLFYFQKSKWENSSVSADSTDLTMKGIFLRMKIYVKHEDLYEDLHENLHDPYEEFAFNNTFFYSLTER